MSIVLLTGCSSGFGLLSAARLASSGHTVYATMRNMNKRNGLLEEVNRRGGEIHLMELDVTLDHSIRTVIAEIEQQEGQLHVLINNAGYGIGGFFEELTELEIRNQFDTNYFGALKVTREALPLLRKTVASNGSAGQVKIINISSVQGLSALPAMSAYAASKHALEGFSESLFHELRPFGIHVISVEPGSFGTRIFTENRKLAAGSGSDRSPYASMVTAMTGRLEKMLSTGKGIGDPERVAKLLEDIIDSQKPKFRYIIGSTAKLRLFLRRWLPYHLYSELLARIIYPESGG